MPTRTPPTPTRRTEQRRTCPCLTAETPDDQVVRVGPSEPDPTDDYEVIDFWGSRDSLSCLAAWG